MCIQDHFRQSRATEKWQQIRRHFCSSRSSRHKLCINFISAHCLPRLTARDFARDLNSRLSDYLSTCSNCCSLGVVVLDFASKQLCAQIVRANMLHVEAPQLLSALQSTATRFAAALRHLDDAYAGPSLDKAVAFGLGDLGTKCSKNSPELVASLYTKLLVQRATCAALEAYVQCCCKESRRVPRILQILVADAIQVSVRSTLRVRRRLRRASQSGSVLIVEQPLQTNVSEETPRVSKQNSCVKSMPSEVQHYENLCEMDRSRPEEARSSTSTRSSTAHSSCSSTSTRGVKLFRGLDASAMSELPVERTPGISFL